MRKLYKYEKETIINWNEAENLASIYTFNASLKRRLADFSRKYPLLCRLERSTPEGSVTYVLDKSRLSIRLIPPYSEERKRLEARNQEIDGMFLSLYTDKAKGILTEQRFMKLTAALEQEQEANQKRLHDLAMMQSRADAQESEVRTFIKEIRRYAAIEELDESVLNRLISKILIGEVKKVDGQKVQEVRIVYNFVGEIPEIAA